MMGTTGLKTLLCAGVAAVLLGAVAAQLNALFLRDSYFGLLALFFLVGAGTAWVAVRVYARAATAPAQRAIGEARRPTVARDAAGQRENGTIKWFDRNKGYGFVVRANGDEIFVHQRNVRRQARSFPKLRDGEPVSFVAVQTPRGWQAEDLASSAPPSGDAEPGRRH